MPSPVSKFSEPAAVFHALADPLRLQVIDLLRLQERCVCELCDDLDINQSKLSFHLKTLKEARLVNARQEGRWMYYSLNAEQFAIARQYLTQYRRMKPSPVARSCKQS